MKSLSDVLQCLPEAAGCANMYRLELPGRHIVIDPSRPPLDNRAGSDGTAGAASPGTTSVFLTHGHYDHIASIQRYLRLPRVEVYLNEDEQDFLKRADLNLSPYFGETLSLELGPLDGGESNPGLKLHGFHDGERIPIGGAADMLCWATPGHTPGSSCLLLRLDGEPAALFTGDTLFRGDVGRSDFPGGDPEVMRGSLDELRRRMQSLEADLPIYSGHGPSSTVGQELRENHYLFAGRSLWS